MRRSSQFRYLYYLVFIPAVLWCGACKESITNKDDVRQYLSEERNGLTKMFNNGSFSSSLSYCPAQLLSAAEENSTTDKLSDESIYFLWSLSADDQSLLSKLNREDYSRITRLLSFDVNRLLDINVDGDTVEILDSSFSPMYGMASCDDILIVLDRKQVLSGRELCISVKEFGLGTGIQHFVFDTADILKLEKLLSSSKV